MVFEKARPMAPATPNIRPMTMAVDLSPKTETVAPLGVGRTNPPHYDRANPPHYDDPSSLVYSVVVTLCARDELRSLKEGKFAKTRMKADVAKPGFYGILEHVLRKHATVRKCPESPSAYKRINWKRTHDGVRSPHARNLVRTLLLNVHFRGSTLRHREERSRWMLNRATLRQLQNVIFSPCLGKRFLTCPEALYPGADAYGVPIKRCDNPENLVFIATDELYTRAWGNETILASVETGITYLVASWSTPMS